nr:hypothetical protein [uncultured Deefgea sp.]
MRRTRFKNEIKKSDQSLTIGLDKLVEWLMVDAISEATVRTFRELWAMALHGRYAKWSMIFTTSPWKEPQSLLRKTNTLDIEKLRESVHLLAMIAEGGIVLYGSRQSRAVSFTRIKQLVHALSESDILGMT